MAESAYNERFIFPDPYDRQAINRTTRYRLKKKREGTLYIDDSIESVAPTPKKSVDTAVVNCDDPCGPFVEEVDVQDDCEQLEQGYSSYDIRNEADSDEDRVNLSDEGSDAEYNMHEDVDENEACTQEHQVQHHIFPGSSLTVAASHTLVMKYKTKHNITLEGLKDLLRLIKLHCPVPNECTTSLHRFRQQFPTDSLVHHFFCNFCLQALESDSNDRCSNVACRKYLTKADCSSFIEVPLAPQLKKILEREGIYTIIQNQIASITSRGSTSDIYRGELYRALRVGSNYVTLILNTDGIPVFKSSKYEFWPVYLLINELPFKMRVSKENRILTGLWYGSLNPDMSLFLRPVVESLKKLHTDGIAVSVPGFQNVICRVQLLCCTCDLPARAEVLNMTRFNGFYGCHYCLQKGKSVKCSSTSSGTVRVWPYMEDNPCGPQRSHADTVNHGEKATSEGSNVYGIKGLSWLSVVPGFDIIRGTSVDYMHCVLLGVCRQLLKLWILSQHHTLPCYIGPKINEIDDRLLLIRPPTEMQRTPRSIDTTRKFWKAHELKAWLLHYSPVILKGILPDDYYQHYLLLVEGVFLLLKDSVTSANIKQSRLLLQHYCFMFSPLYGERNMSANVHGLLHLPDVVKNLGPLWSHSCFPFESANGHILKLFHGSQGVEKQVIDHVMTLSSLNDMAMAHLSKDSYESDFYMEMSTHTRYSRLAKQVISSNHTLLGKPKVMEMTTRELEAFPTNTVIQNPVLVYPHVRVKDKDRVISSQSTSRAVKRNNSGVMYTVDNCVYYGILQKVILAKQCDGSQYYYALVLRLHQVMYFLCCDTVTNSKLNEHIIAFHPPCVGDYHVIPVQSIFDKCIIMEVQSKQKYIFVSIFPNCSEVE